MFYSQWNCHFSKSLATDAGKQDLQSPWAPAKAENHPKTKHW